MNATTMPRTAEYVYNDTQKADVLIVGNRESHARTDRKCLRSLGAGRAAMLASGAEAAKLAAGSPPRLLVCDESLDDMQALEFIRLLRLHPDLQELPVLMLSQDNTREAVLQAMQAGCSDYLLRPYSLAGFSRKVRAALEGGLRHGDPDTEPSVEAFEAELLRLTSEPEPEEDPLERVLQDAVSLLRSKDFKKARERFRQALEFEPDNPTAHHGLGRCWLAMGHPEQARESLRTAADSYMRKGMHLRAKAVFEELRKRDPDAKDPLSSSVEGLLRNGEVVAAAQLVLGAHNEQQLPENFMQHVSRACHLTKDPMGTARRLCDALEEQGGLAPATAMRGKLLASMANKERSRRTYEAIAERKENTLEPTSNLRAILAVARYTFQAYRRNTLPEQA